MVHAVRISAVLLCTAGLAYADLDLTPRLQTYELEGVQMRQLVFNDGEQQVTYSPPRNWEYSGGGNRFVLRPKTETAAEAEITTTKTQSPASFNQASVKRLTDEVLSSVPENATNVELVSQQVNPLLIDRKETLLVIIRYNYYSQSYQRSVMFLNRKNEQIRFQLTSYRDSFEKLQKSFESSHYSWQNL